MKHKQWDISNDSGFYVGVHPAYDPTPAYPYDQMGDVEHMVIAVSVEDCIKQIDEMEMEK